VQSDDQADLGTLAGFHCMVYTITIIVNLIELKLSGFTNCTGCTEYVNLLIVGLFLSISWLLFNFLLPVLTTGKTGSNILLGNFCGLLEQDNPDALLVFVCLLKTVTLSSVLCCAAEIGTD